MFVGTRRRIVSVWLPRLSSDRVLRLRPVEGPFAVTLRLNNIEQIHCLNHDAEVAGLRRGMSLSEARAFCPVLRVAPADPACDARMLGILRRWATRYCPWVGLEETHGLTLDITGAAHLWGDERAMLDDMQWRLERAGLAVRIGLADTRGAAWALAHHGGGIARPGESLAALEALPVAGLRLDQETNIALQRLGLRTIGALARASRAPLARRFGPGLLTRLDQATGVQPEAITPLGDPPPYAVRLTLPEPIGLVPDVMAGTARLLDALCSRFRVQETGARALRLTLRRIDQQSLQVDLRLAAAMRDPARILPLFARAVEGLDSGFGIDQLRLEAIQVEPLPIQQVGPASEAPDRLDNLITRIGTRIGLDNILRFVPADSHIPERSFVMAPAAGTKACEGWRAPRPRPLRLFAPEPIATHGAAPPARFRWRRMRLTTARATGPERIAPEWWVGEDSRHSGLRDYWRVETHQGRRLWLFHTPQNPGWFVHGEFA
ncbi:MAG: DNA polymerase Y family protein [Paracoccaceae bacterium]|nr:MAG: DNA polymerase Y family protein [Paracoccaceae bacterium]